MLDLGWSEILIIGVVALIVVGPKDLPKMLRTLGQYAGRAKGIAREFRRSMDDAARQADIEELHEVKKGLDDMHDAQHKMQRDLSQSFLDGSKKSGPDKPNGEGSADKKSAAKKPGGGAAAGAGAPADDATPGPAAAPAKKPAKKSARKSATKPATKSAKKPATKSATKVSEPQAEPGGVSGA